MSNQPDIRLKVLCDICHGDLETILEKKPDVPSRHFHAEIRVVPCETCVQEKAEEKTINSIQIILNDTERESISII